MDLQTRARAAAAIFDLAVFGFNPHQRRDGDGKWTDGGGVPPVDAPTGPAWGPFKLPIVQGIQFDYGHLAHEDNSGFAADSKYTNETFKVADLHPTQEDDGFEWGDGEGDAKPFVITKDGKHYLVDGHHRAVKAGKTGSLDVWHLDLDNPGRPVLSPPAPVATTKVPPLPSPRKAGGAPGPADPSLVEFSSNGKKYKGLELDLAGPESSKGIGIRDSRGIIVGHLRQEDTGKNRWSYTDAAGTKVDIKATTQSIAFAHAGEIILARDPDAGTAKPQYRFAHASANDAFAMPDDLADYWIHGEGAAKVRWCTEGAFERARRALREHVPAPMLDGTVANLYKRACGKWPGQDHD